ncbi:MAG TPA: hypothetical protein EYH01_07185 [Campylobacterales bacterium]|nr:hypothetical protein [Campylobacterales bacterium]HIP60191.1 hypothetical protein [Campylobacterales bacterium]
MSRNRFLMFAALGLVLLLFTYIQKERAKDAYMSQKEDLLVFEKEAKELGGLKSKHGDKKAISRSVSTLLKIKAPSKDFTKSNSRVLEFEGLDKRVLNQLIKKIQNSTLEIRKLDIIRESASAAKLRVEIKK